MFKHYFPLYYTNMDFILTKFTERIKQHKLLTVVYLANIFLSFHYYFIIYINSSFLSQFFNDDRVSNLYTIGSIINLILLLNVSKILNKVGNYTIIMSAIALEAFAIFGLIFAQNPLLVGIFFLIHQIVVSLILFNLDVFLESESVDETKTGGIRGTYLTLANITLVIAPMLVGLILADNQFNRVYFISLLCLIPLFILARRYFKNYTDVPIAHIKVREAIITFLEVPNLFKIFMCHLILQLFYALMIIYMPVHLNAHIGFSWEQIGVMFTIMLLPFALFELPIGKLADNTYGEKEILTIGLIIMGLATLCISFITAQNFLLWTALLFLTRTGASFVEITSDSFFFKQVNQSQTDEISIYRTTRPLGFIIGPIAATFALKFLPYNYIFLFLGITVILGTYWSLALKDTR